MSFLSNILKKAAPVVAQAMPGTPIGTAAAVKAAADAQAQQTFLQETAKQHQQNRIRTMELFNGGGTSTIQRNLAATRPTLNQELGGYGFLDTVRSGIREVGGLVSDVFGSGIPQLFGVGRTPQTVQQPAITTTTRVGAQESQGSGSIEAGMGAALPSLVSAARGLLKSPAGQLAVGTGAGVAFSSMGSSPSGMRITRKMKSQARMILNMTGGNLAAAADILGIDQNMLVMILLKRFRNDGPVVTKAALRKTKQTIRRLHSMQDVLKSITPTAAGRRRAPMKRASTTTLIKN
jgi:hypothetical protein